MLTTNPNDPNVLSYLGEALGHGLPRFSADEVAAWRRKVADSMADGCRPAGIARTNGLDRLGLVRLDVAALERIRVPAPRRDERGRNAEERDDTGTS